MLNKCTTVQAGRTLPSGEKKNFFPRNFLHKQIDARSFQQIFIAQVEKTDSVQTKNPVRTHWEDS